MRLRGMLSAALLAACEGVTGSPPRDAEADGARDAEADGARDAACTEIGTDQNCRACGVACGRGQRCVGERCQCVDGRTACGPVCTNVNTDPDNCGGCGLGCPEGALCRDGRCACSAPGGQDCAGRCVDLQRDPQHCGTCTTVCPAITYCSRGRCVCPVGEYCGGRCVDTRRDLANCGGCGNRCPEGTLRCDEGVCVCNARGDRFCGIECVDLSSNARHCGGCWRSCPTPVQACVNGRCACTDARETLCGSSCVDLLDDRAHCGACARQCGPPETCVRGSCVPLRVSPALSARVGNRRPTFRWTVREASVEVCADAACASVIERVDGTAARGATLSRPLAPGTYYWRVRTAAQGPLGGAAAPFRVDARDVRSTNGTLPPSPDLDNDGFADIVSMAGSTAYWVVRGGRGSLGAPRLVPSFVMLSRVEALRVAGDTGMNGRMGVLAPPSNQLLTGAPRLDEFARSEWRLASTPIFDVNGDGYGEYVGNQNGAGVSITSTALLSGGAIAQLPNRGFSTRARAVAALGDVNGDDYDDVAFGAPLVSPTVYVYFGSATGLDRSTALPPTPRATGVGEEVLSAGDVNGDGFADILVGMLGRGAAVYLGGADAITLQRVLDAPVDADLVVGAVGDVDGDGFSDVLASPRARGELWLFRGEARGVTERPVVLSDPRWSAVESIGVARDIDGDGFDDAVLGAPSVSRVYVLYGAAAQALQRVEVIAGAPGSDVGRLLL